MLIPLGPRIVSEESFVTPNLRLRTLAGNRDAAYALYVCLQDDDRSGFGAIDPDTGQLSPGLRYPLRRTLGRWRSVPDRQMLYGRTRTDPRGLDL